MSQQTLGSRWPIYVPGMNQCRSIELYAAIYESGCIPSLVVDYQQGQNDIFFDILSEMVRLSKNDRMFSVTLFQHDLRDKEILKAVMAAKPAYIEYWPSISAGNNKPTQQDLQNGGQGFGELENENIVRMVIQTLKKHSRILMRVFERQYSKQEHLIDGYCLKSKNSAGRYGFHSNQDLLNIFCDTGKLLIPQGGIGTPQQVRDLLAQGASAVGIGTVFAASQESPLSPEAKNKIISADKSHISRLDSRQNALIFTENLMPFDQNDWNRTESLKRGIANGEDGHLYVGTAIEHIDRIASVKDIVTYLTSDLKK